MNTFRKNEPSKLTLEIGDNIYEATNPNITMESNFDGVTIVAECRDLTIKLKEDMGKVKKKIYSRVDSFPKDGGKPVNASVPGYFKIPWFKGTLTLIAQSPDGQIHYAKTLEEKKAFAWGNFDWILVCWPGAYSQDIFLIEDMTQFRKALGFKRREETIVTDEDGNEWVWVAKSAPPPSTSASGLKVNYTGNSYNLWNST